MLAVLKHSAKGGRQSVTTLTCLCLGAVVLTLISCHTLATVSWQL